MQQLDTHRFLPRFETRHEYFRFLDAQAIVLNSHQYAQLPTQVNISAFILEGPANRSPVSPNSPSTHFDIARIDDDLLTVRSAQEELPWAIIETEYPRFPVLYTALPPNEAAVRLNAFQADSSQLDRTWFSSTMYLKLWDRVRDTHPLHRFSSITFEHEQFFARQTTSREAAALPIERRKARIKVTERLNHLADSVLPWSGQYSALSSIVQMRIPAPNRGGYDVYHDGRVTNKSDSVALFREEIRDLTYFYDGATRAIEDHLWPVATTSAQQSGSTFGMPLVVTFSEPLTDDIFRRWISTFRRKNNRFRLWGQPISRGPQKVHIYAVDNLLWQTIDLEITPKHLIALLPQGTCGNTVHRLVTAIQRFVDPAIKVNLGNVRYEDAITDQTRRRVVR